MIEGFDSSKSADDIWELAKELFPLHRTLINKGFDQSLAIIQKRLDMKILEYPSGEPSWDWIIPDSWNVDEAYIEDSAGRRLVDLKNNNLHLSAYSQAFSGKISRDELLKHLNTLPDQPDAIPYNFLFYKEGWEFNIAHNTLSSFKDDHYVVKIAVDRRPGRLKIAECFLPGESPREIWLSTYLCHPSMGNDNISGVVTAVEVFKHLKKIQNRRFSYRLLILPESIGAVTYLSRHEDLFSRVSGGLTAYVCGDSGNITYKRSYHGHALIDQAAMHFLKHRGKPYRIRDFDAGGSDERQYNAPGVRMPFGALTRTPAGEFPGYHTSNDNLDAIGPKFLADSAEVLINIFNVLEMNRRYINNYKGEPFFSKHKITYPSHHADKHDRAKYYVKILAHEIDGKNSLLDIADKWNLSIADLNPLIQEFLKCNLIKPVADEI